MGNLALTIGEQGRAAEAEALHQPEYEMKNRVLGAEHPNTLASLHNLALSMHSIGKASDAMALMLICYESKKKKIGATHPSTKRTLHAIECWQQE
jgi:hypothetical protein